MRKVSAHFMGELFMKQLAFDFSFGGHKTPSFATWFAENSADRQRWGDTPYTRQEGLEVYEKLVKTGFFERGQYHA